MKKNIHPKYGKAAVKCSCGNMFEVGSTQKEYNVEICSACHPFYTGKKKIVDSRGRVDKFKKRLNKKTEINSKKTKKSVDTKSSGETNQAK